MALQGFGASNYLTSSQVYPNRPVWINAWGNTSNFATFQVAVIIDSTAGINPYTLLYVNPTQKANLDHNDGVNGNSQASTLTNFPSGSWGLLSGVEASATSRSVYINAANKVSDATSLAATFASTRMEIGQSTHFGGLPWAGSLDEISLYDFAPADADVLSLYSGGPGGIGQDARYVQLPHLIGYWKFDGSAGQFTDLIGGVVLSVVGSLSNIAGPPISTYPPVTPTAPTIGGAGGGGGAKRSRRRLEDQPIFYHPPTRRPWEKPDAKPDLEPVAAPPTPPVVSPPKAAPPPVVVPPLDFSAERRDLATIRAEIEARQADLDDEADMLDILDAIDNLQ